MYIENIITIFLQFKLIGYKIIFIPDIYREIEISMHPWL